MKSTRTLLIILIALILFAVGFVGANALRLQHNQAIQSGNRPQLPNGSY